MSTIASTYTTMTKINATTVGTACSKCPPSVLSASKAPTSNGLNPHVYGLSLTPRSVSCHHAFRVIRAAAYHAPTPVSRLGAEREATGVLQAGAVRARRSARAFSWHARSCLGPWP
jgi:hypothetical protein